jgi:hypothetical protein
MTNTLSICAALLLLAGCHKPPMAVEKVDNNEFRLERLFTHDSCSVYRFADGGRSHYYTDCRGRTTSTYSTSCGKGCSSTHYDEIETNE